MKDPGKPGSFHYIKTAGDGQEEKDTITKGTVIIVREKEDASFAWGKESADCVQCGIDCGDAVDSHIVFRDTDGAEK